MTTTNDLEKAPPVLTPDSDDRFTVSESKRGTWIVIAVFVLLVVLVVGLQLYRG